MDKKQQKEKITDGYSLINKYDKMCLEKANKDGIEPSEERMLIAFQALEEIVPKLGVYSPIFTKLKDDFHSAIYSDELTTHTDGRILKIPYFTLIRRVYTERNDKVEVMTEQLETVKKRLFEKHKQLEEHQQKIAELEETVETFNEKIYQLEETLVDKNAEIDKLEEELRDEREKAEQMQDRLEGDVDALKDSLDEANQEIEHLSKYKKGYDDLYYAFLDTESDEPEKKKIKPVISTKRANLMNNIESAQKLEEQIMSVMNTAVEEFDRFLEEHKGDLEKIDTKEDLTEAEREVQEMDIEQADQELEAVQERFKNTVGDISNELQLLKQHGVMLMEQLQILEHNKPTLGRRKERSKTMDPQGIAKSDSILSAGLGDDNDDEDIEQDPFIPQERVFSKYAAMVYTSNNHGKSFEEVKGAKFCASCGEKTTICPHKLPGMEKVFEIPPNCTHLKISRPKVRVNKELIDEIMKPLSPELTLDMPSTAGTYSRQLDPTGHTPTTSRESPSLVGSTEAHMPHTMHRLFDDYKDRTTLDRNIPRNLSLNRTLSLMEQFWAFIMWKDDNSEEDDYNNSILDYVYLFMGERYMIEDIMYLAAHDFLSSVAEYSGHNKTIQVFGNILAGNLDGSCFRYAMLIGDIINLVEWKEVRDFRAFASVIYPFLGEDDLETLQMSYTSFTENKISAQLVCNFIMNIILKYREPRFLDMEHRILPFQTQETGQPQLTEKEFKDAMDNILPLANEKLYMRLFYEAEKAVRVDGFQNVVPVMRLSQITGYLSLLQIANVVRQNVAKRVQEWRERPSSSGSGKGGVTESQLVHTDEKLITMSSVKALGLNVARRGKHRTERLDNQQNDW